jgi:hypothetical protein
VPRRGRLGFKKKKKELKKKKKELKNKKSIKLFYNSLSYNNISKIVVFILNRSISYNISIIAKT